MAPRWWGASQRISLGVLEQKSVGVAYQWWRWSVGTAVGNTQKMFLVQNFLRVCKPCVNSKSRVCVCGV